MVGGPPISWRRRVRGLIYLTEVNKGVGGSEFVNKKDCSSESENNYAQSPQK